LIDLQNKRVLIAQAQDFMGPALPRVSGALGSTVVPNARPLGDDAGLAARVVTEAGDIDVLIKHLTLPVPSTQVTDVDDVEWRHAFLRTGSTRCRGWRVPCCRSSWRAALRGQKRTSSFSAARGAQIDWTRAAGVQPSRQNLRLNAIAQNFVDNPTYFPPAG